MQHKGDERILELCEDYDQAWHVLERYREKLIEHKATRAFGLKVQRQAGSWGVWIVRRM